MYKELIKQAQNQNFQNMSIMEITTEELNIQTLNDKLEKFDNSIITKYIVSANYQNKKVRLYTEYLDNNILDELKTQAEYLDITTEKTNLNLETIQDNSNYKIDDPTPITTSLLNLNNLKKEHPLLKEISAYYTEKIIKRKIITVDNTLTDNKKEITLLLEIMVKDGEKISTSYYNQNSINNMNIKIEPLCQEAIQNAIDKLNYKEIENGTYKVILTSKVMGDILNKFINIFSKDSIDEGTSMLAGKLNSQVFSKKITIIEDPSNPSLFGKRLFDDSGTKTYYKQIVTNGIFKQPLYNTKTALKDNVKNTGNDYGEISARNMYIKPGSKPLNELINSVEKGILIDSVKGLHAGINPISGDISLQSEGYYIENGKKKYATKLFVLSTNIKELLNNVIDLSNNLEFYLRTTASPDMLIENIKISK